MGDRVDVLVVGAGPTGLTLANELLRQGVTCRLIEQLAAPVTYSKAAVIHARTMEMLDDMGIASAILEHSKEICGVRIYSGGKVAGHVSLGIDSAYPHAYGISQHDTELVLARHFESQGGVIERKKELGSLVNEGAGVHAVVGLDGGSSETIDARFVVGCDGAHSVVRKALGFTFEGSAYEVHVMQADVRVDFRAPSDPTADASRGDEIHVFLSKDGPLALFPLFKDGRYRVIVVMMPGAPDVEPTLENFQRFVKERGPADARLSDPAWMVPFRIHCRRTNRYRDKNAFLAGDAAHIHSPVGGQGMNTGMQDAYNLAWKLALVLRGRASPSLLDSYEAERQPVAKDLLATTDAATRGLSVVAALKNTLATDLRDMVIGAVTGFGPVRAKMSEQLSMLGIAYHDSPIVKEDRTSVFSATLTTSHATEAPGLADWSAFGDGPRPGDRAPEIALAKTTTGATRMGELLRGTKHALLLFDGAAATPEGYKNLAAIGNHVRETYGDLITPHVVVPYAEKPAALEWSGSLIFDESREVHKRYGARSECLYLVRPDKYIGYRAQPASFETLDAYLRGIFTTPTR